MSTEYYLETKDRYLAKLDELMAQLPECARVFLLAKGTVYKASTRVRYAEDLLLFFNWLSEVTDSNCAIGDNGILQTVKPADIDEYMHYLEKYEDNGKVYHNDQAAKKRKLATLRSFFKFCFSRGIVDNNPAALVDSPKLDKKDVIALDQDDREQVLSSLETGAGLTPLELKKSRAKNARDTAIIYLLLGTGIRVSELVGLDLDDVDLARRRISIIRKGGNQDHVFFNDVVADVLQTYIEGDRRTALPLPGSEDALFVSQKSTRMSVSAVERMVKKYSRNTQYGEAVTPHKYRSSFASKAVEDNPLSAVSAALGHVSTSTTSRYYLKVTDDAKRKVSETAMEKNNIGGTKNARP